MENSIYSTRALIGMMQDESVTEPVSNYWLSLCFPNVVQFDGEFIEFGRLSRQRKLAPLVVPTTQGKPIYSAAEARSQVKPAYVKPKDAVSASRVIRKIAGQGELNYNTNFTPAQRYNLLVADILNEHRRAIERRWEWMASEAVQDGAITLQDEAYPLTLVDFERDPGHTITLAGANRWGQSGVNPLTNLESWRIMARQARFGGVLNRATMGVRAWELFRSNADVRETLKDTYRPGTFNTSLSLAGRQGLDVEYMGVAEGLEVYVYSDYYQAADGTTVPFLDPRDVVLTGPGIDGIRCFAAIQDVAAQFQPLAMFPKMWPEHDPSATFIMTQSAPLMVPMNPNCSVRIRVTDV